jgi:hypothetical protein
MTFSNAPSLQGTSLLGISRTPTVATNDQIQVTGTVTYGGALIVTNLDPNALANGDKFQLFNAASFAGTFTSLILPPLDTGLSWKTNLLLDGSLEVSAPPAIPISRGTYTQNFDSLGTNDSLWRDNSTLLGWYAARSIAPAPINSYSASDGSLSAGSLYSFGTSNSTDRALGSIASDSFGHVAYGLCFTNDLSTSVSNFNISYTGEQWRAGGSGSVTNTLTVWYQVSSSAITNPEPGVVTNWTGITNLFFDSPNPFASGSGHSGIALDGNQATNRQAFSSVLIPGLVVSSGQHVFFRWLDLNDSGPDMGMALDDLLISFSALAPRITSASVNPTNGFIQIFGLGQSNHLYAIQAATNLVPPVIWQPLGSNTADAAGLFQFIDTNAPAFPVRFYRALSP